MNKLKSIIIIAALSVFGFKLTAQSHKGKHKGHLEHLKQELNLTDDQKNQFETVKKKYKPEMKAIRKNDGLNKTDKKQKLDEIRARMDTDLKGFLSDDQFNKEIYLPGSSGAGLLYKHLQEQCLENNNSQESLFAADQ